MSLQKISAALEKRLGSLSPAIATVYENESFEPTPGVAYQRAELIPNKPVDHAITFDVLELRGLFQITLCYPLGEGRGAAGAQAHATAEHFAPLLNLTEPGWRISITSTPRVSAGVPLEGRWVVPVTVEWRAFKT